MFKIIRTANTAGAICNLLKGQLRYLNNYFEIVAVAPDGPEKHVVEKREGIKYIPLNMKRRFSVGNDMYNLIKMIIIFIKEKPVIIHSITPKAGFLSMIAGFLCRVPIRIHTFTGLVFPSATGIKRLILMFTDKLICKCATNVYGEGFGVKKDLEKFKITHKNISVIANGNINGVDLDYFYPQKKQHDNFTFIYCGRIVADKGMNELADAFKKIIEIYPKIQLLLVGKYEDELDPVKPKTKNFFITSDNVEFVEWQTDLRPYFARADVLVFPSYREGFPNVVLQASAMGLPSIVTDINGCNEIIQDNINGWIIPPKNSDALFEKMIYVINNSDNVEKMTSVCYENIFKKYSNQYVWESTKREYNNIIQAKWNKISHD